MTDSTWIEDACSIFDEHARRLGWGRHIYSDNLRAQADHIAAQDAKIAALVEALGKAAERLDASLFTNAEHAQAREIIRTALESLGKEQT